MWLSRKRSAASSAPKVRSLERRHTPSGELPSGALLAKSFHPIESENDPDLLQCFAHHAVWKGIEVLGRPAATVEGEVYKLRVGSLCTGSAGDIVSLVYLEKEFRKQGIKI